MSEYPSDTLMLVPVICHWGWYEFPLGGEVMPPVGWWAWRGPQTTEGK